jgi:AraC family transcriptional regulator
MGAVPSLRLSSSIELVVVAFEREFIESVETELEERLTGPLSGKLAIEEPELSMLVSLLMKECDSGGLRGRLYAESLAHAIAILFLHISRGERTGDSVYRHVSSPQSIRRVLNRIHAEFDKNLNINSLASESGYSRRHFLRIFEEVTGYTPHQYLLQLRIKHAKELLRKTSMPLIDIAAYSGFASQSHMSQIFRKFCASTPSQVRRNLSLS